MLPHYRVLILLMGWLHPKQDSCIAASEAICCPASDPMCSNRCPCLAAPPPLPSTLHAALPDSWNPGTHRMQGERIDPVLVGQQAMRAGKNEGR